MRKLLAIVFALVAAQAAASDTFQGALAPVAPTHPALYSFADVYRITVGGSASSGYPALGAEPHVRVAAAGGVPAETQFTIVPTHEPRAWLLALAGLAAAFWVARRRLGYF